MTGVLSVQALGQSDTIFLKGSQTIYGVIKKETADQYFFSYTNENNSIIKSSILKGLVDSVKRYLPVALAKKKQKKEMQPASDPAAEKQVAEEQPKEKSWKFSSAIGINLAHALDLNNPYNADKRNLSLNTSLDVMAIYGRAANKLKMSHELHYILGIQREGLSAGTYLQRMQDNINTLHDVSIGLGKSNKWNINIIAKANTSAFTIFDGNYFKDVTGMGRVQAFASPYKLSVAPGIKYQPNDYFRLSLSPYSFEVYGVKNNEISGKGIYITDLDAGGNYKKMLFKRLGAELNLWYDRNIKEWLQMQYRIGVSSDYIERIGRNGYLDALFITRIKLLKAMYLTHRAGIQNNLAGNFWKPHFVQDIMLSYNVNF